MRSGLTVVACGFFLLAGCSGGSFSGNTTEGSRQAVGLAGAKLSGVVHGGQNPIAGAHVYLFAAASGATGTSPAGQAAYGGSGIAASASNMSQSLLTSGTLDQSGGATNGDYYVTTGPDGSFSISGDYTCTAGQQVYLYSVSGDPGLGTGVNTAAGLMAALGSCPAGGNFLSGTTPISYVVVNEVSTVAAAYAMAGFATDAVHVGSSGTALALTGIQNAFANAANLETIGTGVALANTPAGNGTVPQAEINTLANILAACVNSAGASSSACSTLFANAESGGTTGTQPTDTATAAINIAHNPGAGITALYGLASGTPPFAPGLTSVPNDWTMALLFTAGLYRPSGIAVDGSGNAWIANFGYNSVVELSSVGAVISGANGYPSAGIYSPIAVAVDATGNVWVASSAAADNFTELSSGGSIVLSVAGSSGSYCVAGANGIAFDPVGSIWVASGGGNCIAKYSSMGTSLYDSGYGSINAPSGISVDASGDAWVTTGWGNLLEYSKTGSEMSPTSGYTGGGIDYPSGIAFDSSGRVWLPNSSGSSITELSSSGSAVSGGGGYTGGGLYEPLGVVIDGGGNVWTLDSAPFPPSTSSTGSVSEFSNSGSALSPAPGYKGMGNQWYSSAVIDPGSLAVDGSGDVWVTDGWWYTDQGATMMAGGITEFIGASTPVVTPLAVGVKNNTLGTRP